MIIVKVIFILLSIVSSSTIYCYEIPKATVQAFKPKGLRVSIPDDPGLSKFIFHGKINGEIAIFSPGDFDGEITQPVNGRWTYENPNIALKVNDVLNYWVFVQHSNFGYRLDDQRVVISRVVDMTASVPTARTTKAPVTRAPATKDTTTTTTTTTTTQAPPTLPVHCEPSITMVRGASVCKGQEIFYEDFATLNDETWKREVKIPLDGEDAEFVSYQNYRENLYIKENKLWIVPKLLTDFPGYDEERILVGDLNLNPQCTGTVKPSYECYRKSQRSTILPPIVSAKISTRDSFSFMFGKIDIRARFPKGDWILPQLYLEPVENYYGSSGFISGQMRIGLIRGNEILESKENTQIDGYRLSGGLVLSAASKYRDVWMKSTLFDRHLSEDFHVYSMTWNKNSISVSVDGMIYANYRTPFKTQAQSLNMTQSVAWDSANVMSPFDREFYISLGVGVGGMADFPDLSRTGLARIIKPWNNTSPKAEYSFYLNKDLWYPTWQSTVSGMQVDYVKVTAL